MSGIIGANNRFAADFNSPDAGMQGNITGLYDIGCVLGSILCFFIGERFGRRAMLIAGGFIMIVGTAILASSYTIAQLLVGRIVTGFGNGMNSSTAPVYQSECSPANIRGALLTLQGTVTILGVVIGTWLEEEGARPTRTGQVAHLPPFPNRISSALFCFLANTGCSHPYPAYWTDYGTSFYSSSFQYRFPFAFQAVFAILLIVQIIGLPETPRWLVRPSDFWFQLSRSKVWSLIIG